jgi:hypothetical protein
VIPIYFYICPDLKFIDENIKLYENHFNIKIVQLRHPALYSHLGCADWQPWDKVLYMDQIAIKSHKFSDIIRKYLQNKGLLEKYQYDCNCMKESDSLNRRILLSKKSFIDRDKKIIYLTKKFTHKDIFAYIAENKIPLTKDYEIFGRSWDGMSYHFLTGVEKYYPEDFETMKKYFPLIEAELYRYKLYKKYGKLGQ